MAAQAPGRTPRAVRGPVKRRPSKGRPRDGRSIGRGVLLVHEDPDLIVIEKASGILSASPAPATPPTAFDVVKKHVRAGGGRGARAWIIHRLDREASGLLVFAKTPIAFRWLKDDFRAKRIERLYTAVVEGEITSGGALPAPSGTIQSFLIEDARGRMRSTTDVPSGIGPREDDEPALAITHYEVLEVGHGRTLLRIRLETGRKNQIRIHLAERGHPVVGDRAYGSTQDPLGRLALHATTLAFTHAGTGQRLSFTSAPPPGFSVIVGANPRRAVEDLPAPVAPPQTPGPPRLDTSWEKVAAWYDTLIDESRSDHYRDVILPGTLRLLGAKPGERILDVACGQGVLCRRLGALGIESLGIDSAASLVEVARQRARREAPTKSPEFRVGDARDLPRLAGGPFDAATCIMALMNIDPLEPVIRGVARLLRPGGGFVGVILHPAFRAPQQSAWGWDGPRQYRRVDGYLSTGQAPITMNPGAAAHGSEPVTTWTFHRPLQAYIRMLADAGFVVESLEEWPSSRTSEPGPRAKEENRARREIPLFLAFRARLDRRANTTPGGSTDPPGAEQER